MLVIISENIPFKEVFLSISREVKVQSKEKQSVSSRSIVHWEAIIGLCIHIIEHAKLSLA